MSFYGTAVAFEEYHEARGRTISVSWDTPAIETALLVASEWLDAAYGTKWIGYPTNGFTQTRQWPRAEATVPNSTPEYTYTDSTIPDPVVYAVYEAAFREATTPGSLTVDVKPKKYKSARIEGAVSVEYNLSLESAFDNQLIITVIQSLMAPFLDPAKGAFSALSGAAERV